MLRILLNSNNRGIASILEKTRLRACKILYSFSANSVTNENPKTYARIRMHKKLHRIIEKEKGGVLLRVRFSLVLATHNVTLC